MINACIQNRAFGSRIDFALGYVSFPREEVRGTFEDLGLHPESRKYRGKFTIEGAEIFTECPAEDVRKDGIEVRQKCDEKALQSAGFVVTSLKIED